tara:strand:- start:377 stop:622 length:246 start_codon:yes stop_codon:yes gene_type:complete
MREQRGVMRRWRFSFAVIFTLRIVITLASQFAWFGHGALMPKMLRKSKRSCAALAAMQKVAHKLQMPLDRGIDKPLGVEKN